MARIDKFPHGAVRFSQLVARAGRPAVHLTLVDPRQDPALHRLDRAGRVVSIPRHHRGAGADYGVVGFVPEPGAQILVFPKSVKRAAGKRIVGLDFDLLAEAPAVTTGPLPRRKTFPRAAPSPAPEPAAPPPAEILPPPSLSEIHRELRALLRLLGARKTAAVRERLRTLAGRIAAEIGE